ncbi:MAG: hypothetical protein OEV91_02380, partial [Desulfobulbaceae bacterium]|nr:hypothetical protein [Desulfobulbaceae bacterium]
MITLLSALAGAPADANPLPVHRLTVGFDLAAGKVVGRSAIDLPANQAATLSLGDLAISALTMDGAVLPADASNGSTVTIPAVATPRTILVAFEKVMATGAGEAVDNLVSDRGITLTGFWHPLLDRECVFELTARVVADFTAIAEAEESEEATVAGERQFHFRFRQPLAAIHLVAGPYVVETVPFGEGRTLSTYFFKEDRELAGHYRDKALAYLNRYEKTIGDFPYRRFSVVENRLPTGFAIPTFTLLGQAVVRLPFITETSLGHEVLHQWFGNSVGVDHAKGNWAEGLTTYLADHAYAEDG